MKYQEAKDTVLQELNTVFAAVDPREVDQMADMIIAAEKVFVCGVGPGSSPVTAAIMRQKRFFGWP